MISFSLRRTYHWAMILRIVKLLLLAPNFLFPAIFCPSWIPSLLHILNNKPRPPKTQIDLATRHKYFSHMVPPQIGIFNLRSFDLRIKWPRSESCFLFADVLGVVHPVFFSLRNNYDKGGFDLTCNLFIFLLWSLKDNPRRSPSYNSNVSCLYPHLPMNLNCLCKLRGFLFLRLITIFPSKIRESQSTNLQ